jgi:hypothetical protein
MAIKHTEDNQSRNPSIRCGQYRPAYRREAEAIWHRQEVDCQKE